MDTTRVFKANRSPLPSLSGQATSLAMGEECLAIGE